MQIGLYETIAQQFHLPDPQVLFSIDFLREDPRPFFYFTKVRTFTNLR